MPPELEPPAGESSAPPGGAIAAPDGSSPAPEWPSAIPADLAKEPFWKEYASKPLPDLLRTFAEQKKYIGGSLRLPPKDAKPEDVAKWKAEHLPKLREAGVLEAVPDAPTGYKVTRPETAADLGWDDTAEQGFLGVAQQAGLTQGQVDAVLGWYGQEFGGALVKDVQSQIQEGTKALQDAWGGNFEAFLGRAERFVDQHFTPETREMLKKSGIARDAAFIQDIFALAGQHVEAGLMRGQPSESYSAEDFAGRANTLRTELGRANPGSPRYAELETALADLYKRQYGTRAA